MSSVKLRHIVNEVVHRQGPAAGPTVAAVLDELDDPLDAYAELIAAPARDAVGLMTRGEGPGFTRAVSSILRRLDMPPAALEHHRFLAEHFEHKRAFFKVEWHFGPDGRVAPLAACYFRRRPELDTVLGALESRGVGAGLHDPLRVLAYTLDKRTVHFVAAAFRPGSPVHHKLYFSQYLAPHTRPAADARIARVLERAGIAPGLRDLWRHVHGQSFAPEAESTLFVSVSLTGDARVPGIKLDYPDIPPALAAAWVPADQRAQVVDDASWACAAAGRDRLSYLGVRLQPGQARPALKYYADFPAGAPDGGALP